MVCTDGRAGRRPVTPDAHKMPVYTAPVAAFALVAASFVLQGRIGFNLADEGFLWHGAMRVLLGDVPIRDFQSYDPGRYYWSALWMKLLGSDGIMALRLGVAVFQASAFTLALLLLRRVITAPVPFVIMALVFLLWFFPRHKLFDLSLSIAVVYVGTLLIERPTVLRHLAAGMYVGLAAVFGRNHGIYALAAVFGLSIFVWARVDRARPFFKLLAFCVGIALGYLPVVWLALAEPGFLNAMMESVVAHFSRGKTNLTLPVPWPWAISYNVPWKWAIHKFVVGMTFVGMPVLYLAGAILLLREGRVKAIQRNSVFVASVAVGFVYMHYAFARADVGHLAHAIFPFLFALLSFPSLNRLHRGWTAHAVPLLLLLFSLFAAGMTSPLYSRMTSRNYQAIDIRGDTVIVDPTTFRAVQAVQLIAGNRMHAGEEIVFAPYWPTMYGVLGRRSPVWETYLVFTDTEKQQRFTQQLELRGVQWAVIGNAQLDGRDDRRFRNTHPFIWQYLAEHYVPVSIDGLPADYRLLRRQTLSAQRTGPTDGRLEKATDDRWALYD